MIQQETATPVLPSFERSCDRPTKRHDTSNDVPDPTRELKIGHLRHAGKPGRGRAGSPAPTRLSAIVVGLAPATNSLLNHLELLGDVV